MSSSTQKPDAGTLDGPWPGPTETLHISPGISATRYPLIDVLKALAVQFIVVLCSVGVRPWLIPDLAAPLPARCRKPQAMVQAMSLHSYTLFLVHFPVLLLVNAAFTRLGFRPETASQASALGWGIAGWAASLWAAKIFYCWTESPTAAWRSVLRLG